MDNFTRNVYIISGLVIIFTLILLCLSPKFEADAYRRVTGKQVGYWDAVWLDLRVQEQVK